MTKPPIRQNDIAAMCAGKFAFKSPGLAHKVMKRRSRTGIREGVFRCPVCRLWHIGRPDQRTKAFVRRYREGRDAEVNKRAGQ